MSITTKAELETALRGGGGALLQRAMFNKTGLSNTTALNTFSLWTSAGWPAAGASPIGGANMCTNAITVGAVPINNAGSGLKNYVAYAQFSCTNAGVGMQLHDRIAAGGNLSGTSVSEQTSAVMDLASVGGGDPAPAYRLGKADYSELRWWIEWYVATGSTAVNATVAVTYDDDSTGNIVVPLTATMRAGAMLPILPAVAGRFIKKVSSITLSASTGTIGNFGVTVTRLLTVFENDWIPNVTGVMGWEHLGFPEVPQDACLFIVAMCTTTTTGQFKCLFDLVQG